MNDVSRETSGKLDRFETLVRKWGQAINLVARRDLQAVRTRHIEDSLQISDIRMDATRWCDLGSGGGFPGIVVAIARPALDMTLIESDRRKATFLRMAARDLDLTCQILCERSEAAPPQGAEVVSARALAPLDRLIGLAERHGGPEATYVFPKGANHMAEISAARQAWRFDIDVRPSKTDKDAVILILENLQRV